MKKLVSLILIFIFISNIFCVLAEESAYLDSYGYKVVSFALSDGEEIISESDGEDIYHIASLSKVYTSALIMKLAEESKLSLDDKVFEILPDFSMADERYKDITVGMLLFHTSGLFGSTLKNSVLYNDKDSWNHINFLKLIKNQRLKFAPGTMSTYSNDGYSLLGLIIEKITGESYSEYLHTVFDPFIPSGKLETASELSAFTNEIFNSEASCGLYSDAKGICISMYNIFATENIVNAENSEFMLSERDSALPGEYFGAGLDSVSTYPFADFGIKAVSKRGDGMSYNSALVYLPEYEICATVILEGGNSKTAEAKASSLIIDYIEDKYGIKVTFNEYEKPLISDNTDIHKLKAYEGMYLSSEGQFICSIGNENMVLTDVQNENIIRLLYLGDGKFETGNGILYFSETAGNTYIVIEGVEEIAECGKNKFFEYYAVKINETGNEYPEWEMRNGKLYFLCDEKYSSLMYADGIYYIAVNLNERFKGFVGYRKISDPFTAVSEIALPGNNGRELSDIYVYMENGKEYIKARENCFVDADSIPNIYAGEKSVCTILQDGYTRWFGAGEAHGRHISATINGKGAYYIYNFNGECVYSSLSGKGSPILPEKGYVAFAGETGTVFEITLA